MSTFEVTLFRTGETYQVEASSYWATERGTEFWSAGQVVHTIPRGVGDTLIRKVLTDPPAFIPLRAPNPDDPDALVCTWQIDCPECGARAGQRCEFPPGQRLSLAIRLGEHIHLGRAVPQREFDPNQRRPL